MQMSHGEGGGGKLQNCRVHQKSRTTPSHLQQDHEVGGEPGAARGHQDALLLLQPCLLAPPGLECGTAHVVVHLWPQQWLLGDGREGGRKGACVWCAAQRGLKSVPAFKQGCVEQAASASLCAWLVNVRVGCLLGVRSARPCSAGCGLVPAGAVHPGTDRPHPAPSQSSIRCLPTPTR